MTDIAIGTSAVPTPGMLLKKPPHLVVLKNFTPKSTKDICFLALDRPTIENGFILVKGFYTDVGAASNFKKYIEETAKEDIVEMMFPIHSVISIQNLFYVANKPVSVINSERK